MTHIAPYQRNGDQAIVLGLPQTERLVLWASRAWISAYCAKKAGCPDLQRTFQHLELQDCIGPFYAVHGLLAAEARRDLDFRCPKCATVGSDEQRMLTMFAAYQQGQSKVAEIILGDWLPPTASRHAAYPARLVANGFAENGLLLRNLASPASIDTIPGPCAVH